MPHQSYVNWKDVMLFALFMGCLQPFVDTLAYHDNCLNGQYWRLWTGHWVHAGWIHYGLNALAFCLLPFVFPTLPRRGFGWLLFISPPLLSFIFLCNAPEVTAYVGFSGVLHTLYSVAVISALVRNHQDKIAWLVLVGLLLKFVSEQGGLPSMTQQLIGAEVMVDAHLYGGLIGVLCLGVFYFYRIFSRICCVFDNG